LFYQGLDESGAETLRSLSDGIQAIRARLEPDLDLAAVRPLHDWIVRSYGDDIVDPSTLRSASSPTEPYAGLKAPVRQMADGRYVPDFSARYLTEDIPFGLTVSRAIGQLAGVDTKALDGSSPGPGRGLRKTTWAAT